MQLCDKNNNKFMKNFLRIVLLFLLLMTTFASKIFLSFKKFILVIQFIYKKN